MQTVFPQRNVEMISETRLGQFQPAMEFLQAAEQGKAEGRAGFGSDFRDFGHNLDGFLFGGLRLNFSRFICWMKILRKSILSLLKNDRE